MGLAYKKSHNHKASEMCFAEAYRLNPTSTKAAEQLAIAQDMIVKTGGGESSNLPLPKFNQPNASPSQPLDLKQPSADKPSSFGSIITIDKKNVAVKKATEPPKSKKGRAFVFGKRFYG